MAAATAGLATRGIATTLSEAIDQGPATSDFDHVQSWLRELLSARQHLISLVLALSPFSAFEEGAATAMLAALDWRLLRVVTLIEQAPGAFAHTPGLVDLRWLATTVDDVEPIRTAFGVDEDLYDADGEFSSARVLSAYYLRPAELWDQLAPHLASLRLAAPKDILVAVSAVGWVLRAPDPVAAYCSVDHLLGSFLGQASDSPVVAAALGLFADADMSSRQGRLRINQSLRNASAVEVTEEVRRLSLADAYKRLVEGPFRRYGWASSCLRADSWEPMPMLTEPRSRLVANSG